MNTTESVTPGEASSIMFYPFISVFAINTLVFFYAQYIKDNSIVDVAWAMLFVVPNLLVLIINHNWNLRTIITFSLVTIWAFRLSGHILLRRRQGEEDYRYADMRKRWL